MNDMGTFRFWDTSSCIGRAGCAGCADDDDPGASAWYEGRIVVSPHRMADALPARSAGALIWEFPRPRSAHVTVVRQGESRRPRDVDQAGTHHQRRPHNHGICAGPG